MRFGVQFRGNVPAGQTRRWFTHSWSATSDVVCTVVPTGPAVDGNAQVEWKVQLTRQTPTLLNGSLRCVTLLMWRWTSRHATLC